MNPRFWLIVSTFLMTAGCGSDGSTIDKGWSVETSSVVSSSVGPLPNSVEASDSSLVQYHSASSTSTPTTSISPAADPVVISITTTSIESLSTSQASTDEEVEKPSAGVTYAYPISLAANSGYNPTHSGYPATDVFAACGTPVLAPVSGQVIDVRRTDPWSSSTDDPYTRGGKYVSIFGVDGVRYYMAHFAEISDDVDVGTSVIVGQTLGAVGTTGRSSACHLHFAISPLCPNDEWWVRRGVIWPYPYFDQWKSGNQISPFDEVQQWLVDNPDGCVEG